MDLLDQLVLRVNAAIKAGKMFVIIPKSKLNITVLQFLKKAGYILNFLIGEREVFVQFNTVKGKVLLNALNRISKPGRRVYFTSKQLANAYNQDKRFIIVSTCGNVLYWTWQMCVKEQGGEILIEIL